MMTITQLVSVTISHFFKKSIGKIQLQSYRLIRCSFTVIMMDSHCITYIDKRKLP